MCVTEYVKEQFQEEEKQWATGNELHVQIFIRFFNINNFKIRTYQKLNSSLAFKSYICTNKMTTSILLSYTHLK